MRFLVKRTPDNFIKSVNDEISSILNRHFDSYYPVYFESYLSFSYAA